MAAFSGHRVWAQTSLPPADGRYVIELIQLIDWSSDDNGDSTIPDVLYHQCDAAGAVAAFGRR